MGHAKSPSPSSNVLAAVFPRPERGVERSRGFVTAFQFGLWATMADMDIWNGIFQDGASSHVLHTYIL